MLNSLLSAVLSAAGGGLAYAATKIGEGIYKQDEDTIRVANGVLRRLADGTWKFYEYAKKG